MFRSSSIRKGMLEIRYKMDSYNRKLGIVKGGGFNPTCDASFCGRVGDFWVCCMRADARSKRSPPDACTYCRSPSGHLSGSGTVGIHTRGGDREADRHYG